MGISNFFLKKLPVKNNFLWYINKYFYISCEFRVTSESKQNIINLFVFAAEKVERRRILFSKDMTKNKKRIKKVFVAILGFTILLVGIALIVLPGPATLVIPAGLAVLATEFVWAENLLKKIKSKLKRNKS